MIGIKICLQCLPLAGVLQCYSTCTHYTQKVFWSERIFENLPPGRLTFPECLYATFMQLLPSVWGYELLRATFLLPP